MADDSLSARNQFFKELKPRCVSINDLAVRSPDKKASAKDLVKVTEDLAALLDRQILQDASVLDEKLADYVFFPLSNILRNEKEYPIRLTEVTIKCFRILVEYGWKSKLPKELAQQLLLLLTFIIAGVPGQVRQDRIPEETELESFRAIGSLVKASGSSPTGAAALVEEKAIPALGHAVTVLLDGINNGRTPAIQLEALQALRALVVAIKDQTALAAFLPGIVSSLSNLLTPPGALKVQKKVLVQGIDTLRDVLTKVLGDIKVRGILKKPVDDGVNGDAGGNILSYSWLNATVAKVKLALASVLKLRNDSSADVQTALGKLCIALLDECHQSLSNAMLILVETAMIVGDGHDNESMYETGFADLARIYPELGDAVKTTMYNWVTSLPRLVQSSDEKVKHQAMQNLLKGQHLATTLQIDSSILDDSLAASLRDSATALVVGSKPRSGLSDITLSNALELRSMGPDRKSEIEPFPPVLIARETERLTRAGLIDLVSKFGSHSQRIRVASDMLSHIRETTGPTQVTSYWLAFELIKSTLTDSSELDDFLDFSSAAETSNGSDSALQELYTFSVSILDSQAEANDIDWRMQALSMEITTFTASKMQEGFRPELIDVLYPITTFLGSSNPQLRQHAIISLNNIAAACTYQNVTDLIIENVDYMVNSVSLRLNTFDISPASTQVLQMMIKLTGPRLIPYLDDVIASIFAALDNYHGYTIFVESLFSVLTEVVQQGAKSDNLLLEESPRSIDHKKLPPRVVSTSDLCKVLDGRHERQSARQQEELELKELNRHPNRPFKATDATKAVNEGDPDHGEESSTEIEKPAAPKTRTFQLLSRITSLTQHYLTSPTPTLRKSLLNLLSTVCPALAPDEEEFLPLVNAVWPVLIERLYDPETFVATAACEALCALCAAAGDFLNTRFKTEWWDNGLGKWCRNVRAQALRSQGRVKHRRGGHVGGPTAVLPFGKSREEITTGIIIPTHVGDGELQIRENNEETASSTGGGGVISSLGLGRFAQIAQLWEAVQDLLIAIVTYVHIDDDIFDQILPLLGDVLESQNSVAREALEAVDADAVWLFMYERGMLKVDSSTYPTIAGVEFVEV
ncbi:armadillo-type protein [Xylaria bambusicola]|uniref:armadillo-type protein n=1 Tax=Xylaria bambusicola TaxID=326684 RepID=UPI002008DA59|nr:armadillo-type protein [Xylaria bambusicola]KAI0526505.1 armadillo-type protein [Xylaria bambusicola]